MHTRREHLSLTLRFAIAATVASSSVPLRALADEGGDDVAAAIRALRLQNRRLRERAISPQDWQAVVEDQLATVPLEELLRLIDLEAITRELRYPADRPAMRALRLRAGHGKRLPVTLFGLRRGSAIPPHAHNNVVAAHLVLDGELRVRTWQRREDGDGELLLEPVRDTVLGRGDVLSVSDDEENAHWLVATSERAHTFDVPLAQVRPANTYVAPASTGSMVFLDPERGTPDGPGLRVPIINPLEAVRRYGRRRANLERAPKARTDRRVAITVDDLPWVGPRSRGIADNLARLVGALARRRVPAHGFVCGNRRGTRAVRVWLDAGLGLGDHTWSHRAYSRISFDALMDDLQRNEEVVERALGHRLSDDGWLRLPYLDHGHTPEKVRLLSAFLRTAGKRLAHVSLDNVDYLFAKAYARPHATSADRDAVAALYLDHLAACANHFEALSRRLYGREVPLVLLLHANELNCERMSAVLDALAGRGYRFVSLDEAAADSAYRGYETRPPLVPLRGDRNLLTQVANARGLSVADKSGEAWFEKQYAPRLPPARAASVRPSP